MAIFGDLGKALGLGTAKQTFQGAAQGALRGAVFGQPFMGAAGGALTAGTQQGQATAVAVPQAPPSETAFSGESVQVRQPMMRPTPISYVDGIQPAIMRTPMPPARGQVTQAGLPAIVGGGLTAGRGVMNMLGIAGGAIAVAPLIIDPFTGEEKKLRVTRRLKSQVKKAVEMFGVEFVAEQMGVDVEVVVYIMTKRMRNDGPYVTKAAVRKTRQTVRKMKNLCDMYEDLRPAARRRAPARKTMSTRITNVK
jgi:hypothetical protein